MKQSETQLQSQIVAYMKMTAIIADAIQDLKEIPSGHLYAQVMGKMSVVTYNDIIGTLIKGGVVEQENFLLRWIGPTTRVMPGFER